jgi:hypothetical protein
MRAPSSCGPGCTSAPPLQSGSRTLLSLADTRCILAVQSFELVMASKIGAEPSLLMCKRHRPCKVRRKDVIVAPCTGFRTQIRGECRPAIVRKNHILMSHLLFVAGSRGLLFLARVASRAEDVPQEFFSSNSHRVPTEHGQPAGHDLRHFFRRALMRNVARLHQPRICLF